MKIKKILSLLLSVVMLFTMLATVSVLTPAAGASDSLYVIHAKGKSDASVGHALFIKVPAANLIAGATYTAKISIYNKNLSGVDSMLLIRDGSAKDSTQLATSNGDNTTTNGEAIVWSENIIATSNDLYMGIRFNSSNIKTADFYMGNFQLIDEQGNNAVPALAADTVFYTAPSATNSISESVPSAYWETVETKDIYAETDEAKKATLIDAFTTKVPIPEDAEVMLHLQGSGTTRAIFLKKASATALKPGTTYKLTIKASNLVLGGDNLVYNIGGVKDSYVSLSKELKEVGNYQVLTAYYTTGETVSDTFFGFNHSGSSSPNVASVNTYIAEMKLEGPDGNVFSSLRTDEDWYHAAGTNAATCMTDGLNKGWTKTIQLYDEAKFVDPVVDTSEKMLHVEGLADVTPGYFFAKLPEAIGSGDYQITFKTKGIDYGTYHNPSVYKAEPSATTASNAGITLVNKASLDEITYSFSLDSFYDIYVGFIIDKNHVANLDFFVEDIKLIKVDGDGKNLVPETLNLTSWYRAKNDTGALTAMVASANTYTYNYLGTDAWMVTVEDKNDALFNTNKLVHFYRDNARKFRKGITDLAAGDYRITVKQNGANFDKSDISVAGVEPIVDKNSNGTYEYHYDINGFGGGDLSVGIYIEALTSAYITEISLKKLEGGNATGENLFTDLGVRDWIDDEEGGLATANRYEGLTSFDATATDIAGEVGVDVADLFALSKLEDLGAVTVGTNDVTTVRATLLG